MTASGLAKLASESIGRSLRSDRGLDGIHLVHPENDAGAPGAQFFRLGLQPLLEHLSPPGPPSHELTGPSAAANEPPAEPTPASGACALSAQPLAFAQNSVAQIRNSSAGKSRLPLPLPAPGERAIAPTTLRSTLQVRKPPRDDANAGEPRSSNRAALHPGLVSALVSMTPSIQAIQNAKNAPSRTDWSKRDAGAFSSNMQTPLVPDDAAHASLGESMRGLAQNSSVPVRSNAKEHTSGPGSSTSLAPTEQVSHTAASVLRPVSNPAADFDFISQDGHVPAQKLPTKGASAELSSIHQNPRETHDAQDHIEVVKRSVAAHDIPPTEHPTANTLRPREAAEPQSLAIQRNSHHLDSVAAAPATGIPLLAEHPSQLHLPTQHQAAPSPDRDINSLRRPFDELDRPLSNVDMHWINAGSSRAEAAFQDPSIGWIRVRAHLDAGGVHASVVPGSIEAAEALGTQLSGLNAHLAAQHFEVRPVTISAPESMWSSGFGGESQHDHSGESGHGDQQTRPSGTSASSDDRQPIVSSIPVSRLLTSLPFPVPTPGANSMHVSVMV